MSPITTRNTTRTRSSPLDYPTTPTSPSSPSNVSKDPLAVAQIELLRTPKYSDITIICGNRRWRCQKSILCQRCYFFTAALTPGYNEAESNTIEMPDDDPDGIDVLLLHIYTLQKPDFSDIEQFPTPSLAANAVFKLADKYGLPDLRDAAKDYFLDLIKSSLSSWHILSGQNKNLWIAWIPIFWQWSMEGSEEIRTAVVNSLVKTSKSITDDTTFQKVLETNTDIALALIKAMAVKGKWK